MTEIRWTPEAEARLLRWYDEAPAGLADLWAAEWPVTGDERRDRLRAFLDGYAAWIVDQAFLRAEQLALTEAEENGHAPPLVMVELRHVSRGIHQATLRLQALGWQALASLSPERSPEQPLR